MATDPNILAIITDQFHPRCLGYAGHPLVQTPNIDRLASEGAIFSRMYTNQPLCMPTRATLFTGLTPRGHGVRMNGIPLDRRIPTITEAMRRQGYHTHCAGKIHLSASGIPSASQTAAGGELDCPESGRLWKSGAIDHIQLPFYGLESVDYSGGCAHGTYGPYVDWLESEHPPEAGLFNPGFKMRTLVTRRHRLTAYSGKPYGELFDLQEDPEECNNLWDDATHSRLRDELRIELLDKIMRTDVSVPLQQSRS